MKTVSLEVAKRLNEALDKHRVKVENNLVWFKEGEHHEAQIAFRERKISAVDAFYTEDKDRKGRNGKRIFSPYKAGGGWEWEFEIVVPTYTLNEIWERLPYIVEDENPRNKYEKYAYLKQEKIKHYGFDAESNIGYKTKDESVFYTPETWRVHFSDENCSITDAAAELLIWCLENGHIGGAG
jgi:hypothetical protein